MASGRLAAALVVVLVGSTAVRATRPRCTVTVAPGGDVQRAVDGAPRHASVCLAAGTFRLRRFVAIERDGVHLRGAGSSTVLELADGVQSPLVVVGDYRHRVPAAPVADVSIEALRLVGGGGGGREAAPDRPYLTNSALVVRRGTNVTIRDVEASACRSACFLTEHDSRDVTIERCTVSGATWDGISLNRTARLRLVGNTIRDNTAAGVTAEHLEDGVIEYNTIAGNGSHGVYLADSYRNWVGRNRFARNTNAGVFLTCAVRYRDPGPVLCWDDSMSQANTFEGNVFAGNRLAYQVAADAAANCTKPGAKPNVSRDDGFVENASIEHQPTDFGGCLRYENASDPSP